MQSDRVDFKIWFPQFHYKLYRINLNRKTFTNSVPIIGGVYLSLEIDFWRMLKQQYILIDQSNGRQLIQMPSEATQQIAQPTQARIAAADQPVKKVRRIEHIENRGGQPL